MGNIFSVLQNMRHNTASYQPCTTVLTFDEDLSISPNQPCTLQALLGHPIDVEGSSNSEGSHETGDSGRYSHDETELTNLSSSSCSRPLSLMVEDSGDSESNGPAEEPSELSEESQTDLKVKDFMDNGCCHHEAQSCSPSALSV